mmetsp:Transcript_4519/g.9103  ORF Transcript_4519/g.9103 Transcript_4519/m.9103 type:complete len:107 (+) Transcript_4519:175-495(+)|eukprot:scaffold3526_cov153-Amphora_coffeaeformis.AAC.12
MLHFTFFLALFLIVLVRPVRGEGRTWVPHPPPHPTFTTGDVGSTRRGKFYMKKEDWQHVTDAKPLVSHVTRTVQSSNPLEDKIAQKPSKYPYASGAFGLEPELGIH